MHKFTILPASTCTRFTALLFLLMICFSTNNADGLADYRYGNRNDRELKNLFIPDSVILLKDENTGIDSSLPGSDYDSAYGTIRLIPFKKRTIPIELQKALYAHGIVGRRR